MLRAEILMIFRNGAEGVVKGNVRAVSKFLNNKYPGRWKNFESCHRTVRRSLKKINTKVTEDPSLNPFRDGRTTSKRTRPVMDDPEIRRVVGDRMCNTSASKLAAGVCRMHVLTHSLTI